MPGTSGKKRKWPGLALPLSKAWRKEAGLLSFPARFFSGKPHGRVHRGKDYHIDLSHRPRAHRLYQTLWLGGQVRCKNLYKQMGWNVAQLVECSPSIQEALGLFTSTL